MNWSQLPRTVGLVSNSKILYKGNLHGDTYGLIESKTLKGQVFSDISSKSTYGCKLNVCHKESSKKTADKEKALTENFHISKALKHYLKDTDKALKLNPWRVKIKL